jgi:hypothetical protein
MRLIKPGLSIKKDSFEHHLNSVFKPLLLSVENLELEMKIMNKEFLNRDPKLKYQKIMLCLALF